MLYGPRSLGFGSAGDRIGPLNRLAADRINTKIARGELRPALRNPALLDEAAWKEALPSNSVPLLLGPQNGVLGYVGLAVLEVLLWRFHRGRDGMCCPSYTELQAATGLCRQSIARALQRLEACGILKIGRRLVREVIDGVMVCRQGSNLYSVHEPAGDADQLPVRTPAVRPFPRPTFGALARMLGWSKLETTGRAAMHENIQNLQCFRA